MLHAVFADLEPLVVVDADGNGCCKNGFLCCGMKLCEVGMTDRLFNRRTTIRIELQQTVE
jgi:hypothetical protein